VEMGHLGAPWAYQRNLNLKPVHLLEVPRLSNRYLLVGIQKSYLALKGSHPNGMIAIIILGPVDATADSADPIFFNEFSS
jgi:hypothetical protein